MVTHSEHCIFFLVYTSVPLVILLSPGLTMPVGLKLSLIPILTLTRHDIAAATQIRELCLKLLPSYPSLSFVSVILQTLTKLATETLVHVPSQVRQ